MRIKLREELAEEWSDSDRSLNDRLSRVATGIYLWPGVGRGRSPAEAAEDLVAKVAAAVLERL